MKIARWLMVVALVGLTASVARADSIDPAIGVQGGSDAALWTGSVTLTITSTNFSSGTFFIDTGTITNFDFVFHTQQGPFSVLQGSAFPNITTIVPGFEALLSGGTIFPATEFFTTSECIECLPAGTTIVGNFFFGFQGVTLGPNGTTTVTITSNVPEPGTITLMLAGLAALGLLLLLGGKVARLNSPA